MNLSLTFDFVWICGVLQLLQELFSIDLWGQVEILVFNYVCLSFDCIFKVFVLGSPSVKWSILLLFSKCLFQNAFTFVLCVIWYCSLSRRTCCFIILGKLLVVVCCCCFYFFFFPSVLLPSHWSVTTVSISVVRSTFICCDLLLTLWILIPLLLSI